MLKRVLNRFSTLNGSIDANQVKTRIDTASSSSRSNDSQPAKHQAGTACDGLSAGGRLFPSIASLPSITWAASRASIRLLTDIRILIWVLPKIEAEVVNHISLLDHIWTLSKISLRSLGADIFKLRKEIGMRRRTQPRKHSQLTEEERSGADGEDCALTGGIFLLDVGEGLQYAEWLGFLLDDRLEVTTWDDEDVKLGEV